MLKRKKEGWGKHHFPMSSWNLCHCNMHIAEDTQVTCLRSSFQTTQPTASSPQKSYSVLGHKAFNFSLSPGLGKGVFQAGCWLALSLGDSEERTPFLLQMTGSSLKTQMEANGLHSTLFHAQCKLLPCGSKSKSYAWLLCDTGEGHPVLQSQWFGGWLVVLL